MYLEALLSKVFGAHNLRWRYCVCVYARLHFLKHKRVFLLVCVCVSQSLWCWQTEISFGFPYAQGRLPADPNYNAAKPERVQGRLCGALLVCSVAQAHTHTLSLPQTWQTTTMRRTARTDLTHTRTQALTHTFIWTPASSDSFTHILD